ncbi:MAG: hypothetical protein R3D25_19565 [Geminicoccaceae bacterium]
MKISAPNGNQIATQRSARGGHSALSQGRRWPNRLVEEEGADRPEQDGGAHRIVDRRQVAVQEVVRVGFLLVVVGHEELGRLPGEIGLAPADLLHADDEGGRLGKGRAEGGEAGTGHPAGCKAPGGEPEKPGSRQEAEGVAEVDHPSLA